MVLVVNVISHVVLVFSITIVVMDKKIYDNNNDGFWDYNKNDCFHTIDSILVVQSTSRKLI